MPQTQVGLDGSLGILDATVYLETHNGPPGADGSTNQALGTGRPAVAFAAAEAGAVSGRRRRNSAEIVIQDPGVGTYQAWSVWTAASGGDCLWIIPFDTNRTLASGDDLRLPIQGLECAITPSS